MLFFVVYKNNTIDCLTRLVLDFGLVDLYEFFPYYICSIFHSCFGPTAVRHTHTWQSIDRKDPREGEVGVFDSFMSVNSYVFFSFSSI